ncbi:hypothetical protein E4U54_006321, partial [Claviceps lovelessii]
PCLAELPSHRVTESLVRSVAVQSESPAARPRPAFCQPAASPSLCKNSPSTPIEIIATGTSLPGTSASSAICCCSAALSCLERHSVSTGLAFHDASTWLDHPRPVSLSPTSPGLKLHFLHRLRLRLRLRHRLAAALDPVPEPLLRSRRRRRKLFRYIDLLQSCGLFLFLARAQLASERGVPLAPANSQVYCLFCSPTSSTSLIELRDPKFIMQPSERSPGLERAASTARNSVRPSQDDDFDYAANAVADGFRPSASTNANDTSTSVPSPSTASPAAAAAAAATGPASPKGTNDFHRPPSTSKPHPRFHDSLTLRNDGLTSTRNGQSSFASRSTDPDSQYPEAIQPSHPYQLYPQRTYSNATSSTEPLSTAEALGGPRAPTHPYTMYTQNTSTSEDPSQQSIPVGFNGMGNEYRRQLGPDGEEAGDLIGPLGHMEELPPYTRYPDEAYVAKPATEVTAVTPTPPDANATNHEAPTPQAPAGPIPGAGGIGLATRNPEFSSTEDDLPSATQRAGSVRSVPSVESYHQVNGAARKVTEKPAQGKWQRRAKKKLWGVVPYWAICLLLSGIVIMGIIMGAVIGTIVTRQRERPPSRDK